jgi:hypothetical protein
MTYSHAFKAACREIRHLRAGAGPTGHHRGVAEEETRERLVPGQRIGHPSGVPGAIPGPLDGTFSWEEPMSTAKKFELAPDEVYIQDALKSGKAKLVERLSMKALGTPDVNFQARVKHLDMDHVHRLDEILKRDGKLSPIVVFMSIVGSIVRYIVADGFHRHEVYQRKGSPTIRAYVIEVKDEEIEHEARLFAAMCNQVTLLNRKPEDIRKAVEMLFADPECWNWSDTVIGNHCGLSSQTMRIYRLEYVSKNNTNIPDKVKTSKGIFVLYQRQRRPEVPRIRPGVKKSGFYATIENKEVYLGPDASTANSNTEAIALEKVKRYRIFRDGELRRFLGARCLLFNSSNLNKDRYPGISGLHGHGVVLVTARFDSPDSVPRALGCVQMIRAISGKPNARMVVVCYPEDGPQASIELARKLGIEFLTPDELVASLKGTEADGQGGPR